MNFFFLFLSLIYVGAIFLMAGSSVVSTIAVVNPYSLLHVPLYGILAFLLYFSFSPVKFRPFLFDRNQTPNSPLPETDHGRSKHSMTSALAGFIALAVAIADEFHQSFIPSRDASFSDVLLDTAGIVFALLLVWKWTRKHRVRVGARGET